VNRDTQSVLLLLVGGAVVRISADNTFLRYVKEWMRPGLLVAGAVLVVLGLVSLWREHRARELGPVEDDPPEGDPDLAAEEHGVTEENGHDGDHRGDHQGDHSGPHVAWLLLLPVLAIFLVAPPALGSYTASRTSARIAVARPADSEFAPLPPGDPVATTLTDYATRAIWDQGRSLQGRRVRMVGFVSPRPAGGFYLTRIAITCCAADARPIRIAVPAAEGSFAADSWVAVTGTYGGRDTAAKTADRVPTIQAESVDPVPAPAEQYES